MLQNLDKFKWQVFGLIVIQFAIMIVVNVFLKINVFIPLVITVIEGVLFYFVVEMFKSQLNKYNHSVKNYLGSSYRDVFLYGKIGIVIYDENFVVTFMSDLFSKDNIDRVGQKVLAWLPEVDELISGKSDSVRIMLDNSLYEVTRVDNETMLIFKDITREDYFENNYTNEQLVIGLINLDNYDESTDYEDEITVSAINSALKTPMIEYAKEHGVMLKRINNSRYLAVLNERIYQELVDDHFSILMKIRKEAQTLEVPISLSMSFARGSSNIQELDEMSVKLMDLAQSRGGDQVVSQKLNEDVKYFGGSNEAQEKRSRVRVRVMANTIRELIQKSSNVIICGHQEADFDCIGAAIGMSRFVECYHKQVCIIAKTGGVEEKLANCLEINKEQLKSRVSFVTENEALNQLRDTSLVIMVDHHSLNQSNGQLVLEKAKRIAIVDHHRRSANLQVKPMLVYIEPAASSSCELVSEFIPYISNRLDINETEATIMLAGMVVDTNNFRKKTGTRTYDAASILRKLGGNPVEVEGYLKDTYEQMKVKNMILANMNQLYPGIVISCCEAKNVTRSLLSQGADNILNIQQVRAAFVIAKTEDDLTCISARSDGTVNVQRIMEMMNGGGHLRAAAVQRKNTKVEVLKEELENTIKAYLLEVEDESNTKE